ncbi:unnamed protein product, partial [marine sediment metagenome]
SSGIKAWGDNDFGQLGGGDTTDQFTSVLASEFTSGVVMVAGGDGHSCVLMDTGGVKCWGKNNFGQLGDGTTTSSTTSVDVSGLSNITAISLGDNHSCALTDGGGVKCWGHGGNSQLGDGLVSSSSTPVDVSGLTSGVVAISAGHYRTCALTTSGGVKCWGNNSFGELGDGTRTNRSTPVDVCDVGESAPCGSYLDGVIDVGAGYNHTCALTSSGGAKCWGGNNAGQLGDGVATHSDCTGSDCSLV